MFETWKLHDYTPGEGVVAGASAKDFADQEWLPVDVPGDVHRALIAAGRIPDPFYDRNEAACTWMEDREWWYRTAFTPAGEPPARDERIQLVFQGLDTFVTIWLNGEELGRHANMFRAAVFDVTERLRYGEANTLALCFDRPLAHVNGLALSTWGRNPERVAMRKAQFGYGWDWGPRLPTIGIWRPVELRRQRRAALTGVHFTTLEIDTARRQALVRVNVEAKRVAGSVPLTAQVTLAAGGWPAIAQTLALHGDTSELTATAYLTVHDAHLWWTHELGDPALYTLTVTLHGDGAELDRQQAEVGIRTIVLDQSPDPEERGCRFFRFVLNGVPIFAKGANWIPADSFVGAISPERYDALVATARDAHMNMLRVWGGGIYEHDAFYDACDRLGLLVWQDFMFSCAMYPEDDAAFASEVAAEARYQVRRLRGHPCLALWCGNNENQWLHDRKNWDAPDYPVPGSLFYSVTLPAAVATYDGSTPYWPGSPFGGNDYDSAEDGDRHNWEVWHGNHPRRFGEKPYSENTPAGVSYRRYAEDQGRFISEFGMHAAPVAETLRRVIPASELYFHSPSMDHHNKDNPKNKGDNLMLTVTGLPATLDDYIDFSMIAQAEGLKFGVEHYRRRMPHCSGTLVWQLNDCWPVLSWSVLDYYGVGKAGYYYLRRAYAPVLASFKDLEDGGVELWITNDTSVPLTGSAEVRLATFAGDTIWQVPVPLQLPARTSLAVRRWNVADLPGRPDRYLSVRSAQDAFPANRHFFAPIKDLVRPAAQVQAVVTSVDEHQLRVELKADTYAYFVHVSTPEQGMQCTDNYFDMVAGERRTIVLSNRRSVLKPDAVSVHWR